MPLLGAHMSIAGGLHLAFDRLREVGGRALQIFTKNERQWAVPTVSEESVTRFLESWTGNAFTYNGSMICMFNSRIATAPWKDTGNSNDVYDMPIRQLALDLNFQDNTKLPPATPGLMVLIRANWRTPAAFTTNVMTGF